MEDISEIITPKNTILFCLELIAPSEWPLLMYKTIRYIMMRSRGYLPVTLTVVFEKKESNDIALELPALLLD